MARRIDTYLESLIGEDKFAFYEAVRDFGDADIAPHLLSWEREHQPLKQAGCRRRLTSSNCSHSSRCRRNRSHG